MKVNKVTKSNEVLVEYLDKDAIISVPIIDKPHEYSDEKFLVTGYFGQDHPGVNKGYVWCDLKNEVTGKFLSAPFPVGTLVYVHNL